MLQPSHSKLLCLYDMVPIFAFFSFVIYTPTYSSHTGKYIYLSHLTFSAFCSLSGSNFMVTSIPWTQAADNDGFISTIHPRVMLFPLMLCMNSFTTVPVPTFNSLRCLPAAAQAIVPAHTDQHNTQCSLPAASETNEAKLARSSDLQKVRCRVFGLDDAIIHCLLLLWFNNNNINPLDLQKIQMHQSALNIHLTIIDSSVSPYIPYIPVAQKNSSSILHANANVIDQTSHC